MPLVAIMTQEDFQPAADPKRDTVGSAFVADLGDRLPEIIVGLSDELHLDPGTPAEAVQVTYATFGPRDKNTPVIWIKIEFTEESLTTEQQLEARNALREALTRFFDRNPYVSYAVDMFWVPGHGFLRMGSTKIEW